MKTFHRTVVKNQYTLVMFVLMYIFACFAINDFPQLEYVKTKIACQNETIHLRCPNPSLLEIKSASFGRAMKAICVNGVNAHRSCNLINKKSVVKKMCDFKPECEVWASEEKFGSDCPEVDKYLNVIYACVRNPEKPTPSPQQNTTSNTTSNHTRSQVVTTAEPTAARTTPITERARVTSRPTAKTKPQKKVITFNPDGADLDFLSNKARSVRETRTCKLLVGLAMIVIMYTT